MQVPSAIDDEEALVEPSLALVLLIPLIPTLLVARLVIRSVVSEPDLRRYRAIEWLFPIRGRWLYYALEFLMLLVGLPLLYLIFASIFTVLFMLCVLPFFT